MSTHVTTRDQQITAHNHTLDSGGVLQRECACGNHTVAGGKCRSCRSAGGVLQRKASEQGSSGAVPPIVHDVLSAPGRPLDGATRAFFEPRFNHDFSRVRVHATAPAAESARAVNALAYTVGQHVVLGAGQYAPATSQWQQIVGARASARGAAK